MNANRFYSVAFDMRNHPKIQLLRLSAGGIIAFGRWSALMGILYDSDGVYVMDTDAKRAYLCRELECGKNELKDFLQACADCDLISGALLEEGHVVSEGICEQLAYIKTKSEAGKKSGESRRKKSKESCS